MPRPRYLGGFTCPTCKANRADPLPRPDDGAWESQINGTLIEICEACGGFPVILDEMACRDPDCPDIEARPDEHPAPVIVMS